MNHDEIELRVTYVNPEAFRRSPQVGVTIVQDWGSFARWLTLPTLTPRIDKEAKTIVGGWCPVELPGGVVKGGSGPSQLLVADVDEAGPDGFDRTVAALEGHEGVVVTSCNAIEADQRHRVVLLGSRVILTEERPVVWSQMYRSLVAAGVSQVDAGCKNPNRLYYGAVHRAGAIFRVARLRGELADVDAMIAAGLAFEEAERAARPRPKPVSKQHLAKYVAAALESAQVNLATASAGARHDLLLRETYALARFGLSEGEIADALLDAFVCAAGESRRREGERAIRDAVKARGAA